jgi:hypothetical protein
VVDRILQAQERGEFVLGVFLDLRKAFDTVDHSILLRKLHAYGVRGLPLDWFRSYLHDRKQFVSFGGEHSSPLSISCGVPQGSILGPLLFLLYINDISHASQMLSLVLFADDTNAFLSGRYLNLLVDSINNELTKLTIWLRANKLSLNLGKTQFILFKNKNKRGSMTKHVLIDNHGLLQVRSTRFLGVIINERLSWSEHVSYINRKIAKGIGIICKSRKVLNQATCVSLYYAFIYPFLNYCVEVWGGTYPTILAPLVTSQKKCARILTFSHPREHTEPLLKRLGFLPLPLIYKYFMLIFIFKFSSCNLPTTFDGLFTKNLDLRGRSTRQDRCFVLPRVTLTSSQHSVRFGGARLWNSFLREYPNFSENNQSLSLFKRNLKSMLMN